MDDKTLASEMLAEIKRTSKRWFIAFTITIAALIATNVLWIWYISLPVEELAQTEVYSSDSGIANYVGNDMSGVINNGGTSDSN